ncbi:Ig-like domain-containing protein, partial [Bacillus mycoides]|uniref:Ig-like domain-containing protein n=1 Tax=Bacillus mycoides TaxID=1405 RepID=UPI003D6624BA
NFSIDIPKQKAGTKLSVTASNKAGTSQVTEVTVKETLKVPDAPKVNEVTDADTKVTGTAQPGSTVKLNLNDFVKEVTADENGNFSIDIPKQKAGTKLSVTASNKAGTSEATEVTVKATLVSPTINDYYTTDVYARGTAPGASKVALYVDGKVVRTATVAEDGTYTIYTGDIVKLQKAGSVFEIAARDAAGNESPKTKQTVQLKLAAPTIQDYYQTDAYAKGTASGASKVALYVDGKFIRTATVEADGTYKIYTGDIAKLQKEGSVFEIAARDAAGNESARTKGTVLAREQVAAPTIQDYYTTDVYAKGTALGASRVVLYVDGELVRNASVEADGTYKIYTGDIAKLQKEGAEFEIAARDAAGTESVRTKGIVKALPATLTVNEYQIGTDNITGTASPSITKVKILVDGDIIRQTSTNEGSFAIYARDIVKDPTQKVEIAGYDSNNQEVIRTDVQVR